MSDESQVTHEVFISYSSNDKQWADGACAMLESHRIRCWIAPRDVVPGTEWGGAIVGGIDACKIMVLIFSAHANESPHVRREVERAISKGLTVLPFRVEDVRPAGAMEYALSNTHWLDAFTPPVERQMESLAESVKVLLNRRGSEARAKNHQRPRDDSPSLPARSRVLAGVGIVGFVLCVPLLFVAIQRYLDSPRAEQKVQLPANMDEALLGKWDHSAWTEGKWTRLSVLHVTRDAGSVQIAATNQEDQSKEFRILSVRNQTFDGNRWNFTAYYADGTHGYFRLDRISDGLYQGTLTVDAKDEPEYKHRLTKIE